MTIKLVIKAKPLSLDSNNKCVLNATRTKKQPHSNDYFNIRIKVKGLWLVSGSIKGVFQTTLTLPTLLVFS